ncbi:MAG TPA: hypothetical protein VFQ22_05095, partial [Longimicrobiales bacterium]|nr:hypothetical protein [Longimicrobiales bacterium]
MNPPPVLARFARLAPLALLAGAVLACGPLPRAAVAQDPHALQVAEGADFRVYDRDGRPSSLASVLEA